MNVAVVLAGVCLISLVLAEPPVGDGYPAARSDHHHSDHNNHHGHTPDHDHQRSLSQEYGPPSRNAISTEYGAPNARSSNSRGSHRHTPATARVSFNQRFKSAARSSSRNFHDSTSQGTSTEGYAPSNTQSGYSRDLSEPRSLSQEYGVPSSSRSLSTEYGAPTGSPAEKYGTPIARSQSTSDVRHQNSLSQGRSVPNSHIRSKSGSSESLTRFNTRNEDHSSYSKSDAQNPSQSYGAPTNSLSAAHVANSLSTSYNPSSTVSDSLSQSYGAPKSAPSSSYGAPSLSDSSRTSNSQSHDHNSLSHSYTAPSERDLSETYGAPNTKSLSQEYGVPTSRNLQTDAVASSYPDISSRSSSSSGYQPAARGDAPSQQYGTPEQNQGYENARARALEELLNQEPANYDFAYQIEDQESGTDFGHSETRQDNRAEGSYFVVLPDGTRQTVDYEADERGFRPRISVEPAAAGYDDNAQDLARSHQGPY